MSFAKIPKPDDLIKIGYRPPKTGWMDTPVVFRPGTWSYSAAAKNLTYLDLPNPRSWESWAGNPCSVLRQTGLSFQ
jgi:hypothetical protein